MRTIWLAEDGWAVEIIDQTQLPHVFATRRLETLSDAAHAIEAMLVRGAPLIGATAAYGLAMAILEGPRLRRELAYLWDIARGGSATPPGGARP